MGLVISPCFDFFMLFFLYTHNHMCSIYIRDLSLMPGVICYHETLKFFPFTDDGKLLDIY